MQQYPFSVAIIVRSSNSLCTTTGWPCLLSARIFASELSFRNGFFVSSSTLTCSKSANSKNFLTIFSRLLNICERTPVILAIAASICVCSSLFEAGCAAEAVEGELFLIMKKRQSTPTMNKAPNRYVLLRNCPCLSATVKYSLLLSLGVGGVLP